MHPEQTTESADRDREQLSAWIDGEASAQEAEDCYLNLRAAQGPLRQKWDRYHLIGDILRSESLARPSKLLDRIAAQIEQEPLHLPVRSALQWQRQGVRRHRNWAYAAASAAAVAFVALVAFAPQMQDAFVPSMLAGGQTVEPISPVQLEDPRLRELLDAHGAMAIRPVSAELR